MNQSFLSEAILHDFNAMLGQYLSYRDILTDNQFNEVLYLGIRKETYQKMSLSPFIQKQIKRYKIRIIVVDTKTKKIISWIK